MHDDTSAWVQAYITVDCSLGVCMISPELDLLFVFVRGIYVQMMASYIGRSIEKGEENVWKQMCIR